MHSPTSAANVGARPTLLNLLNPMQRYLLSMIVGALLTLTVLGGALYALKANAALPPPQFSNSLCIDEKLRTMRVAPPSDPSLLVVGSSVAWRHFNGAAATALDPDLKVFNAGFCGAKISEMEKITGWLTGRLPSVKHVVLIASPLDFEACTKSDPSQFNIQDADDFVFGGSPSIKYYARYFDPVVLASNARIIRQARTDLNAPDPLVQDQYGDAPNEPVESRGLFYGAVQLDDACFAALRRTAQSLAQREIAFDMTITPIHPEWTRQYATPAFSRVFKAKLSRSLSGTGGRFFPTPYQPHPSAFYDAVHIRWSATSCFTAALMRRIGSPSTALARAPAGAAEVQPALFEKTALPANQPHPIGSISKFPSPCAVETSIDG